MFQLLRLFQNSLLHLIRLIPDSRTKDVAILSSSERGDILVGQQPRIRNDNGFLKSIRFLDSPKHWEESLTLKRIALEDVISDGKSSFTYEEPQHDLGMLELAVFAEADLPKVILVLGLEVDGGHVVEHHGDRAEDALGMGVGDCFCLSDVCLLKCVKEAVNCSDAYRDPAKAVQVVHGLELAYRESESRENDVAEKFIGDRGESHAVEEHAEDELGADGANAGIREPLHNVLHRKIALRFHRQKRQLPWLRCVHDLLSAQPQTGNLIWMCC